MPVDKAVQIYVRMRPRLPEFEDEDAWRVDKQNQQLCSIPRDMTTQLQSREQIADISMIRRRYADAYYNYNFKLDNVFGPEDTTEVVYEQSCRQLIHNVLQGYNATIFLYGQTTSGKTYTMLGDDSSPGILPFTLLDIFREADQLPGEFKMSISYLEIYNEQINDLLNPSQTTLKIHEDNKGQPVIPQLKHCPVKHFNEAIMLLRLGEEHRCYREKSVHEHSSRSHTIFQIKLERIEDNQKLSAVLNLVDLAGSERLNEDEVVKPDNSTTEETGYINKSLFVLSNVINKLADGKKYNKYLFRSSHIPYRDSKLTRILSNSLGGNSLTTIICTVSPATMNFYQTLSTLRFATRAKKVHNKVGLNQIVDPKNKSVEMYEQLLLEKQTELDSMRRDKEVLEQKLRDSQLVSVQQSVDASPAPSTGYADEINKLDMYASFLEMIIKTQEDAGQLNQASTRINSGQPRSRIGDYQVEATKICAQYKDEVNEAIEKYQRQLVDVAHQHIHALKPQPMTISTYQQTISNQIDSEFIFNEIYVNAILNPSTDLLLQDQQYTAKELTTMLQIAYNEAIASLQNKLCEYTRMIDGSHRALIVQQSTKLADQHNMRVFIQEVEQSHTWAISGRDKLQEQYKRKIAVLEQAFLDVEQKILQTERFNFREQRQSTVDNALKEVQPKVSSLLQTQHQHVPTPKFIQQQQQQSKKGTQSAQNMIYVWGSGKDGRLGNFQEQSVKLPTPLTDLQVQFEFIACGYYHSAAITSFGQLYCWGKGNQGQLGLGNLENSRQPTLCRALKDKIVIQICCGWQHSMCLTDRGEVYTWGASDDGQLGTGQKKGNSVSPLQVQIEPCGYIACGHSHSGAITTKARLFTWGCNNDGRLMIEGKSSVSTPTSSLINKHIENSAVYVKRVSMGVNHTIAVMSSGSVYTAGSGSYGQLGLKPSPDGTPVSSTLHQLDFNEKVVEAACGEDFTLLLSDKGDVFSLGKKSNGTLGHTMSLIPDCLWQPKKIETIKKVKMVSAGKRHSSAITQNNEIYCWGFNFYDQLGISGQMRFVDEYTTKFIIRPVKLELPSNAVQVACGEFHTLALLEK